MPPLQGSHATKPQTMPRHAPVVTQTTHPTANAPITHSIARPWQERVRTWIWTAACLLTVTLNETWTLTWNVTAIACAPPPCPHAHAPHSQALPCVCCCPCQVEWQLPCCHLPLALQPLPSDHPPWVQHHPPADWLPPFGWPPPSGLAALTDWAHP